MLVKANRKISEMNYNEFLKYRKEWKINGVTIMRFKLRNHELMDLRTGKIYINKDEAMIDAINLIVDELDKLNADNKQLMGLINDVSKDCSRHLNDIDSKINNINKRR